MALYLGDTDREGDLKSRLLLIFEVNLALNRGDTDRDGDLKSLVFEVFDHLFLGDREFFCGIYLIVYDVIEILIETLNTFSF